MISGKITICTPSRPTTFQAKRASGGNWFLTPFLPAADDHLLAVCRYVERNPLRARLVRRAEAWRWSSLWRRERARGLELLSDWPVARPDDWRAVVNRG